jgi:hypothetical protein
MLCVLWRKQNIHTHQSVLDAGTVRAHLVEVTGQIPSVFSNPPMLAGAWTLICCKRFGGAGGVHGAMISRPTVLRESSDDSRCRS